MAKRSTRLSIGVVEDSDEDFYAYGRAFQSVGELRRWTEGEALIASLLEEPDLLAQLDLLILDLSLSGVLDGVHVAHTVRNAPGGRDLPIVVLTGSTEEINIKRALAADVSEYEIKPGSLAELRDLVKRTAALVGDRPAVSARSAAD